MKTFSTIPMMLAIGLPSVEAFLTRTNDSPTSSSSLLLLLQGIERRPNAIQPLSSSPSPEESSTTVRGDAAGNPQFPQQPADVGLVDRPSPPPPELLDVVEPTKQIWNVASPVTVQGRSLKTWAFPDRDIDKVHLVMKTDGRPLLANVDLWQGPRNTPQRISVYTEDGDVRPFSALIATTGIGSNVVRVVNAATLEFPLKACIVPSTAGGPLPAMQLPAPTVIQGGSLRTWSFEAPTKSVMVLIKTDGRPMNARIELLQGPNTIKQVMELYTEDGVERPFFAVMETPGTGNVVRVVNTAPMEFPLTASVEPFETEVPGVELPQSGILGGSIPKVQW